MAASTIKASILCFPQFYDGNKISVNILFVPREDPLSTFAGDLDPDFRGPAFATANLRFAAKLIGTPDSLPAPASVTSTYLPDTVKPAGAEELFLALKEIFNITLPSNILKPRPHSNTFIRKYLPVSYRNAFDFSHPRSPKYGVVDDAYFCAMKKKSPPGQKQYSTNDVSWGKVLALALRQPVLAEKLGMIFKKVEVELPSSDFYKDGGWMYIDLAEDSDYYRQSLSSMPVVIKKYAARIPRLTGSRVLFAPLQFLATDSLQTGNFDTLFKEASDFDDGFARIVHCTQPQKANLVPEQDQEGSPLVKDFGIQLGWEDEQILEWHNRMLLRPDHEPLAVAVQDEIPDVPMGILSYRVDVKFADDPSSRWHSLNKVTGPLKVSGIDLGTFTGELGVEVAPVQLDGLRDGVFWLPSYFTQWNGKSVVLRDDEAATLFGLVNENLRPFAAVGTENVPLRYGKTYMFRIRMSDMTGGGPTEDDSPQTKISSQTATCRFRRFVPPAQVRIPSQDVQHEPAEGEEIPDEPPVSYLIYRPLLGYPALIYTGAYSDAFSLLKADIAQARIEEREPAYPDPYVTMLKIEVSVSGLSMDNDLSADQSEPFYPVYTTTRYFPDDPLAPLQLDIEFTDAPVIKFGDAADLGDLTATGDAGPLKLPTARDIRIILTPVGMADPALEFFGSEAVRFGASSELFTRSAGSEESQLFDTTDPVNESFIIKGIMLQPDRIQDKNHAGQLELIGKKGESGQNLMSRLADELKLNVEGMTLTGRPGQRIVFGCSRTIRHMLSPEYGSITFSSKADLINQWINVIQLTVKRDWSWDGLNNKSFILKRNGEVVGTLETVRTVNNIALQNPQRHQTQLLFFDAFDPKPEDGRFPEPLELTYEIEAHYVEKTILQPDNINPLSRTIKLPIATKSAQIPKVASAGIALSAYERDREGYAWSHNRRKMLWLEFEEPVHDPNDMYFVHVRSYAPDPLLIHSGEDFQHITENSPYLDPEHIRVITPEHSDDKAGLNAMQPMVPSDDSGDSPPRHFLVPLPSGLTEDSPELFGFFVYEICIGHEKLWSTAQARFGRSIRLAGVQHPAPPLVCTVARNEYEISVSSPFATTIFEARNLTTFPKTELWGLLYAQVMMADSKDHRNVLIAHKRMYSREQDYNKLPRQIVGYCNWPVKNVTEYLEEVAIPLNTRLSCLTVEVFPNTDPDPDPLKGDLGFSRIYRTSQLEPVQEICL
jgi:hypothetical protein